MAEKVLKKATVKRFEVFSFDPVDIIIPFHAAYGKVTRLIESIFLYTNHPYKITLVDDASPNADYGKSLLEFNEKNKIIHRVNNKLVETQVISLVRSDSQDGFAASLNKGIRETSSPWLVFLHSDCVCESQGWLGQLGTSLRHLRSRKVKMVSVKTDNPGDYPEMLKRQKVVTKNTDTSNLVMNGDIIRDSAYIPLLGAMCHRELFNKVGLFKEYPYAWYEDLEFAYRMRHHGYFQGVSGTAWLHHEGGGTIKKLFQNREFDSIMQENRVRCIADIKAIKSEKKVVAE